VRIRSLLSSFFSFFLSLTTFAADIVFPYLRDYLATLDTNKPIHLGRRLHLQGKDDTHSYYSGGASIILSRDAVKRLGERCGAVCWSMDTRDV
jgi:hypothetical protein